MLFLIILTEFSALYAQLISTHLKTDRFARILGHLLSLQPDILL